MKGCVRYDDGHETYDIVPMEIYSEYVERLIVMFKKKARAQTGKTFGRQARLDRCGKASRG